MMLRLLRRLCPPDIFEEIEGDLLQRYNRDMNRFGARRAKLKLNINAMKFLRPGILLRRKPAQPHASMITNHIRLSFRNMMRNKTWSIVNISGLSIAITAFFFITQYVSFELGFDRFHEDHHRLYRVVSQQVADGGVKSQSAKSFVGIRDLIKKNFPGVATTGFVEVPIDMGFTFARHETTYSLPGTFIQADSAFFEVFSGLLIQGDPKSALKIPTGLIVSEKVASQIFPDENAIGQTLDDITRFINDAVDPEFEVTGVFKDIPSDSHLRFDIVLPIDRSWDTVANYWYTQEFHTYIKTPEGADIKAIESRLNSLLLNVAGNFDNVKNTQVKLQPITDINLNPGIEQELQPATDPTLPLILALVGAIIMLIAWINYVNLETARFVTQSKEVGIRRVIGSSRRDLLTQILIRYVCLNVVAITVACVFIFFAFPWYNVLTGVSIIGLNFGHKNTWIIAGLYYLSGTVVAGLLPMLLSLRLNPISIIKGTPHIGWPARLRSSLMIVQYVASIALIVFVSVAYDQISYMLEVDRKLDVEQVLVIENALAYTEAFEGNDAPFPALKMSLEANASIGDVSCSSNVPGRPANFTLVNEMKRNKTDPFDPTPFKLLFIDYNYIPLYGLKLKAGRNYLESEAVNDNTGRIIVNEAAIRALGFKSPEEAVNQKIFFQLWPFMKPQIEIVGILEDHHHESIKEVVEPTIYFLNKGMHQLAYFSIRINKHADKTATIAFIESTYKKLFPKNPFSYFFVKDLYLSQFNSDYHFARVFQVFSAIASLLACLGILGITLFETNTRLKEVSIRKVLGASAGNVIALLSRQHVILILLSVFAAVPLAYYLSYEWLQTYPVRMTLTSTPFVIAILTISVLTIVASGAQTLKAAQSNPIDHLKNE